MTGEQLDDDNATAVGCRHEPGGSAARRVFGLPLSVGATYIGAMNLYRNRPGGRWINTPARL